MNGTRAVGGLESMGISAGSGWRRAAIVAVSFGAAFGPVAAARAEDPAKTPDQPPTAEANAPAPAKPAAEAPAPEPAAGAAFQAADPRALGVLKDADEAARGWTGFTCKFKSVVESPTSKSESSGEMIYLKPGRLKMTTLFPPSVPGQPAVRSILIDNGTHTINVTEAVGAETLVSRSPSTKTESGEPVSSPLAMIHQLDATYELKFDPDRSGGKLFGQKMNVLSGPYRAGALEKTTAAARKAGVAGASVDLKAMEKLMGSVRLFLGEEDHFLHRVEMIPPKPEEPKESKQTGDPATDAAAKKKAAGFRLKMPQTTTDYFDVDFKAEPRPADFNYETPANARVVDTEDYSKKR